MFQDPELSRLIEFLEEEKKELKIKIDNCIKETDYLLAHFHNEALGALERQLNILYKFRDPQFLQKTRLDHQKKWLHEKINESEGDFLTNSYLDRINEIDNQLSLLNQKNDQSFLDTQFFDDAVFDLVEGKIRSFKLHLMKKDDLYLKFEILSESTITISLPLLNEGDNENYYVKKTVYPALEGLGFKTNYQNNTHEYSYNIKNFKDALSLKSIISRFVFDVFSDIGIDNPTSIELFY